MSIENKKIAVLGLGEENVALINYLVNCGAKDITICDAHHEADLDKYLAKIDHFSFKKRFGEDYLSNLGYFDLIFRTPGLAYLIDEIQDAKELGVEISSQTKLFFDVCPCPIIGITGTKGKGTTSTLIYEILKNAGRDVYLGGNIGNAPIEFIGKLKKDSVVVLELSSFQLQDLDRSPHISVILNIGVDHLDVHRDRAEYVQAKANIVKHQSSKDYVCINEDYLTSVEFALQTSAQTYWFSRRKSVDQGVWVKDKKEILLRVEDIDYKIIETKDIVLRGEHNWENISAAALASYLAGVSLADIASVIKEFKGLEHRLEFVEEIDKVKYYNDSFSTTPDTTIAAISSFTEPIVLVAGGSEKHADYKELGRAIARSKVKTLITIGVTGPRIKEAVISAGGEQKIVDYCNNLDEVFDVIKEEVEPGDIVLLSPASASFGWFANYKDRGKKFKDAVLRKFSK
ncbi:MAG: UDP-N-acetylmuramoyl-L-alanine--D-glutamate ligase [Candidatus Berkelbacteria bacterium]